MRRFFTGPQRDMIIKQDGCCRVCGFIEKDLYAIEADDESFLAICSECVAHDHLAPFNETEYKVAYLPELSVAATSHFCRASALHTFAALGEMTLDVEAISQGLLPEACAYEEWWTGHLKHGSAAEARGRALTPTIALKTLKRATDGFAILKGRMDVASKRHPGKKAAEIKADVGVEMFAKAYRLIPLAISTQRIRSWGTTTSSFKNHPKLTSVCPEPQPHDFNSESFHEE